MERAHRRLDVTTVSGAVAALREGGLVVLPTETVYGLGADARQPDAVRRIFRVKDRPPDHPLIVHIGRSQEMEEWARSVPPAAFVLAGSFWPGPLTLVLRRHRSVSDVVTGGLDTVAVRVPDHPVALALLRAFGGGVAAPSANRFGRVSPTTAADVVADLGPFLDPETDVVLDGGPCSVGVESTIVDLTGPVPAILRPGAVTAAQLASALGEPVGDAAPGSTRAPGMLPAHYAPNAQLEVVASDALEARVRDFMTDGRRVAVLAPMVPAGAVALAAPRRYAAADLARVLYRRLREADEIGVDVVLVVPPADENDPESMAAAVLDRLRRAEVGSRRAPHESSASDG